MDADALLSIDDGPEIEEEARGSRFIGQALQASTSEHARSRLEEIRTRYPDATHHCWATRFGPPKIAIERSEDDGEPGRTAGPPILRALTSEGVTDAIIVVTRYYGGTNLGKGGLIRAYGSAARAALAEAPRRTVHRYDRIRCETSFEDLGAVETVLAQFGDQVRAIDRQFELFPAFEFEVRASRTGELTAALENSTAGRATVEIRSS